VERYQVIIVGGGPVGVALAVDLAQRGVEVLVLERHREVGRIPKGQNLMHRSLEHFAAWGCVDELRSARLLPPGYPIGGITGYRNLAGEHWYLPEGLAGAGAYFSEANERLPQYRTEEVLRVRLGQLRSATLRFGVTVTAVEQDAEGTRVRFVTDEVPDREEVLAADYVVGCDGARSLVREQSGVSRRSRDLDQKMVLAVFSSPELHEWLARFPERTTYRVLDPAHAGVWLFFGRVRLGETWFFHGPVPRETTAEDTGTILELMHAAAGVDFACEFEHIGFWELRIDVATEYRRGRVFIAGDACHSHPPYGGLGLNTGLEDVRNLGWKLWAALGGFGGDRLLDSYSAERQPIFEQTGEQVIAAWVDDDAAFLARYSPERDPEEFALAWGARTGGEMAPSWYEPHYDASSIVVGGGGVTGIRGEHQFTARAGHHLAPCQLSSGKDLFAELGDGFALLAFDASEAAAVIASAAAATGVPLVVVEDSYADDRLRYGARLVLVRPDHFVAWRGDAPPEAPEGLLRAVTGR